jgi:hypothetical protein
MTTRDWKINAGGKQHAFKLVHGMNHRRFFLDGELLLEQKERGNRQVSYSFDVEGAACEVNLYKVWMEFEYSFFFNDVLIPPTQNTSWFSTPRHLYTDQRKFWFELSKVLNLKPIPIHPEFGYSGKPLVGEVGGFLAMVYFGVSKENSIPLVFALVRYKPVNDVKLIRNDLTQILSHAGILRKSSVYQVEPLTYDHALISWFFNPKKLNAEQIKQSLSDVLGVLSKHTSGVSPFKCENPTCKNPSDTNLKLVLVNGYPSWMCAGCIAELDSLGDRTQESYKKAPLNFGRGLAVGILATILGSFLWAAVMIFMHTIAAALAIFILFGVVKAMDWVKTKRTFWSILTAGFLSIGGSILGSYLGGLWLNVTEGGISLSFIFDSFDNFIWYLGFVWNALWEKTTVMGTTIMFSVLGVGFYLWGLWSQHRNQLKQAFKPDIHVIET